MKIRTPSSVFLRIGMIILIIEVIVVLIILAIGWQAGWTSLPEFKEALQIAGILQIGVGFLGIKGNWEITRSFEYQYSMSATSKNSWERTQQTLIDFANSYTFMVVMLISGVLSIVIGLFI
jgi:hypothetical protein